MGKLNMTPAELAALHDRQTKSDAGNTLAEELAEVFYQAKVPEGKWKSIPKNAKENYIAAMQSVLDYQEKHYG